jgi:hypothetical protein
MNHSVKLRDSSKEMLFKGNLLPDDFSKQVDLAQDASLAQAVPVPSRVVPFRGPFPTPSVPPVSDILWPGPETEHEGGGPGGPFIPGGGGRPWCERTYDSLSRQFDELAYDLANTPASVDNAALISLLEQEINVIESYKLLFRAYSAFCLDNYPEDVTDIKNKLNQYINNLSQINQNYNFGFQNPVPLP